MVSDYNKNSFVCLFFKPSGNFKLDCPKMPLYKRHRGEIGIHDGFKIRCLRACRFKSGRWYHPNSYSDSRSYSF